MWPLQLTWLTALPHIKIVRCKSVYDLSLKTFTLVSKGNWGVNMRKAHQLN